MTVLALDTGGLRSLSGLLTEPSLQQAATFLADLVNPGVMEPPGEFDSDKVGGYFDEEGNRISKEEWRKLGRRKAEKEIEGKEIEDGTRCDGQARR